MLYNYTMPYPDELLISYFYRILKMNGRSARSFMEEELQIGYLKAATFPYDLKREYMPFYNALQPQMDAADLYLATSTLAFESLFMTKEKQTRFINAVFRPIDDLNIPIIGSFTRIKICPSCVDEDRRLYGEPYYHRSHQLSGVGICHKHHTRLLISGRDRNYPLIFDPEHFTEVTDHTQEDAMAYMEYAQTLFESRVSTDSSVIKKAIDEELVKRGYKQNRWAEALARDFYAWKHRALFDVPAEKYSYGFKKIKSQTVHSILPMLMFLYPDSEDLIRRINTDMPLINKYVCDTCGYTYYSTAHAHESGWGCPDCDGKLSYDERYNRIVEKIGNGEYSVKDSYITMSHELRHHHRICGKDILISPTSFIYLDKRCPCENYLTIEVIKTMAAEKGLELVSYTKTTNATLTFFHPKCGGTFQTTKMSFVKTPMCRCCESYRSTLVAESKMRQKIKDLVGDEYSLVSYNTKTQRIKLCHNTCGMEFELCKKSFLSGTRCPQCSVLVPYSEIDRVLWDSSKGRFVLRGFNSTKQYINVMNTETGEQKRYKGSLVVQELSRPTPSDVFPGIRTGHHFQDFNACLQLLREYHDENGRMPSPSYEVAGAALGEWCIRMKKLRAKGKLSEEKIQTLTDAGFDWSTQKDKQKEKVKR